MGFLAPLFLAASALLAVPLILHLFHRHESRRVVFPALRYLLRTEREHARRIRLRQWLLLLTRCLAVLLLVLAGARLFVRGQGSAHPPTALVLVLDNSLSSGRVLDDDRVLDRLKALAHATLEHATPDDRIWVLRAGQPWEVAPPGGPAEARRRVDETRVTDARGDLDDVLRRAAALVRGAGLEGGEIQLLSDLQASAFGDGPPPTGEVPLVVWAGVPDPTGNRYVREVRAGGGLPPLADRRTEVSVAVGGTSADTVPVPVRLELDGRLQGAATVRPGEGAVLPVGPFPTGAVVGRVEAEPDALGADDRRWVVLQVRPPPTYRVAGDAGAFVDEALAVLAAGGRLVPQPGGSADVVVSVAGAGLDAGGAGRAVVIPPTDPAVLPALNRRLADAGVAWRYENSDDGGETRVSESTVPVPLDRLRVRRRYRIVPVSGLPEAEAPVRLADGTPWLVAPAAGSRPVLLLASPLDEASSSLPVDAAMVPLLEWMLAGWAVEGSARPQVAGAPLPLPPGATAVEMPDGTRVEADGTRQLRATSAAGVYTVLRGDTVLDRVAVNPPVRESLLEPLPRASYDARLGESATVVTSEGAWNREIFTSRRGHEVWRPLVVAVLLLLLVESWMASSGGATGRIPTPAAATQDVRSAADA